MPAPIVEYSFIFHFIFFYFFVKNEVFVGVWTDIGSLIQFHCSSCLFLCKCQVVFNCPSSIVQFEVRDCDASRSSYIIQGCFGCPGFFAFPYEVEYYFLKSVENFAGILVDIALNLEIVFGKIAFLLC